MILDVNDYAIVVAVLALIAIGCSIGFIACRPMVEKKVSGDRDIAPATRRP